MKNNYALPPFFIVTCHYKTISAGVILEYSNTNKNHVYLLKLLDKSGNELRLKPITKFSTGWIEPASIY